MKLNRVPWEWIAAIVIGFGIGLVYAWVLSPAKYVDATPQSLRDDFKDNYRAAIAAAYSSSGDLERARARLDVLGDPDPSQALTAQAQRMLAAGDPLVNVQQVAMLAAALQGQVAAKTVTASPTRNDTASSSSSTPAPITPITSQTPTEIEPTGTDSPLLTATPRPLPTSTPTLGAPFQLVGQDTICDVELAEGLLQVIVTTVTRKQIPGAEIIITWNNGEEHIFTGYKPELGKGYADFVMTPGVIYSVRMVDGGTPANELSAPDCTDTNGNPYLGGLRVTFQRP